MSNPNARPRSYTLSRWSAECVTHFINFGYVGALWGCFNPMSSGQYGKLTRPGPYYYGATVGSIVFVSKVVSGGVAVARNRDDALVRYHIVVLSFAYFARFGLVLILTFANPCSIYPSPNRMNCLDLGQLLPIGGKCFRVTLGFFGIIDLSVEPLLVQPYMRMLHNQTLTVEINDFICRWA